MGTPGEDEQTVARLQRVFGRRLREARISNRLSRSQVCRAAGLDLSQLRAVELGTFELDTAIMGRLAAIVQREPRDLLSED